MVGGACKTDVDDADDDDETHKIGLAARWRTCIWSACRKEGRLEKPASCKYNIMMVVMMMVMMMVVMMMVMTTQKVNFLCLMRMS